MPKVATAYVSIRARLDRLEKDLSDAKSTTLKRANETSRAVSNVFRSAVAYLGVRELKAFGEEIFGVGKQVAQLDKAYTEITGSAAAASREFEFLRKTSDDLGQNFYDLADAYKGIAAASKGTALEGQKTRDIFVAITKASASLGLSTDDTRGALVAIQQMMSKGKVSAEELRQQLGERLPGAFNLMAEAMGVTTAELDKLLKDGKVLASDALPRLAAVLESRYSGAVDDATRASNKLSEAWTDMKAAAAGGTFLNDATDAIKSLTAAIQSPGLQEGFATLIGLLGKTASAIANLIQSTAGWAAVGRGDLSFFKFATMNAQELSEWLKQNRSDVGRLDAELKKLNEQLTSESSFLAYSPEGIAGKNARIEAIQQQIKTIREERDAILQARELEQAAGYSPVFVGAPAASGAGSSDYSKKELADMVKSAQDMNDLWRSQYADRYDIISRSLDAEVEAEDDAQAKKELLWKDYTDLWQYQARDRHDVQSRGLDRLVESEKTAFGMMTQLSERTAEAMQSNFSNVFYEGITGEFTDLADVANSVFKSIARAWSDMMGQMLAESAFGKEFQGGGWLSGAFDWLFGGGKASGGWVTPGTTYVVGEKGPELLTMGSQSGYITPNGAAGGAKIQVIINGATDTGGVSVRQSQQGDVTQVIVDLAARSVANGGNSLTRALESAYGLQRTGRRA